ncbi:MAG: hypothetical protein ACR2M4_12565 [Actinomycetota bacterium]
MPSPEVEFESELEVFRREAESAVQFFYAWRTVNEVAAKNDAVVTTLNKAPLFWNTTLDALQTAAFIALGRVFDQEQDTHNIDRVLRIAQRNPLIFSLEALAERKRRASPNAHEWLDEYLQGAYVPTADDFRRLRKHVAARRKVYTECFRPLRHKVFAHKQIFKQNEAHALFANAKIKEPPTASRLPASATRGTMAAALQRHEASPSAGALLSIANEGPATPKRAKPSRAPHS